MLDFVTARAEPRRSQAQQKSLGTSEFVANEEFDPAFLG